MSFWAPYMGPNASCSDYIPNSEHRKVHRESGEMGADCQELSEERLLEQLFRRKLVNVQKLAKKAINLQNEVGVCHVFTCNDHFSTKKNAVNGSGDEQERKVGSNVEINGEADSLDFAGESDTEELISNENSSPTLKRVTFNLQCSPMKSRKRI
eukprot:gene10055-18694_t